MARVVLKVTQLHMASLLSPPCPRKETLKIYLQTFVAAPSPRMQDLLSL